MDKWQIDKGSLRDLKPGEKRELLNMEMREDQAEEAWRVLREECGFEQIRERLPADEDDEENKLQLRDGNLAIEVSRYYVWHGEAVLRVRAVRYAGADEMVITVRDALRRQ